MFDFNDQKNEKAIGKELWLFKFHSEARAE